VARLDARPPDPGVALGNRTAAPHGLCRRIGCSRPRHGDRAPPPGAHPHNEHKCAGAFEPGDRVKISGTSKGKGFQGTVKRHNFARGPVSHGSHNVRAPGSIGAAAYPARVFKGIRGPGQMGNKRVTQKGLEVVRVDADKNLLMVRGSVPGPRNGVVEVRTDG